MKIIDINDIILGNVEISKSNNINKSLDLSKEIQEVVNSIEGLYNKEHLKLTMSHTEFYEANPLLDNYLSDYKKLNSTLFKKELFYSMLCETYIPYVPSDLTALLVLTRNKVETPNRMIVALDKSKFKKYITQQFNENNKILKEIIDKIWGYSVNLVTKNRPMVINNNVTEIYIDNINDILLCNNNINDILKYTDDINNLWYSKDKGIVLGDKEIPLRTLIHEFGITKNDLDLRNVFSSNES